MNKPFVSVIIPTFNRDDPLINTLKCMLSEDYPSFEVIVIDQSVKVFPRKNEFLKQIKDNICYYKSDEQNAAVARNIGIKKSKGEILLFLDDDVVFKPGLIKAHSENYANSQVGAVCGRVVTSGQQVEPDRRDTGQIKFLAKFTDGFSSKIRQEIQTVITCNASWRKKVLDEIGLFDERFTGPIREDSDLSLRTIKAGYKIIFDPVALVNHNKSQAGGFRKTEGRLRWYFGFFKNETYFLLKYYPFAYVPIILLTRWKWAVRCFFGFGREVSFRSVITPIAGVLGGYRAYRRYKYENRG